MEGSGSAELREGAALMRAQLAASSGDAAGALAVLQQLPEDTLRHQPAVVATVVRLQACSISRLYPALGFRTSIM